MKVLCHLSRKMLEEMFSILVFALLRPSFRHIIVGEWK